MKTEAGKHQSGREKYAESQKKFEKLRTLNPRLIDISLRESCVGSSLGQTLAEKLEFFGMLRGIGFRDIILGSLNYGNPQHLQVDDDFMMALRDSNADLSGCFALIDPGCVDPSGAFLSSRSMLHWDEYQVPHAIVEVSLADRRHDGPFGLIKLKQAIAQSTLWLQEHGQNRSDGVRVVLNLVDGFDAFHGDMDRTCDFLEHLSSLPLAAISFEDGRGTYFHFHVGAFVELARSIIPQPIEIWVHVHSAFGLENASVIDALLAGADGVWAALPKRAGLNGHASLTELIANLLRTDNKQLDHLNLSQVIPVAQKIAQSVENSRPLEITALTGADAFRLPLEFFRQDAVRPFDLLPDALGGAYSYRICPVVSDQPVLAHRLAEITGLPAQAYDAAVLDEMVRLMRESLRSGIKNHYDDPVELLKLLEKASAIPSA